MSDEDTSPSSLLSEALLLLGFELDAMALTVSSSEFFFSIPPLSERDIEEAVQGKGSLRTKVRAEGLFGYANGESTEGTGWSHYFSYDITLMPSA